MWSSSHSDRIRRVHPGFPEGSNACKPSRMSAASEWGPRNEELNGAARARPPLPWAGWRQHGRAGPGAGGGGRAAAGKGRRQPPRRGRTPGAVPAPRSDPGLRGCVGLAVAPSPESPPGAHGRVGGRVAPRRSSVPAPLKIAWRKPNSALWWCLLESNRGAFKKKKKLVVNNSWFCYLQNESCSGSAGAGRQFQSWKTKAERAKKVEFIRTAEKLKAQ